ncbi:MAG: pantetheine-phosphate adenylyltransferase, partial [Bacteroidales bacterium]
SADFEYERMVALANKTLEPNLETIFLLTDTKHSYINSSLVRDILHHGGNPSEFVPKTVCELIISTKEK